jgi:anthranilate phosphoribosyltransferase
MDTSTRTRIRTLLDKDFVILHSLGGYDEISLTGPFKYFYNEGERLVEPSDVGLLKLNEMDIKGGTTVEESAKIFMQILEGNGTDAQNSVVIANAGMALFASHQEQGLQTAMGKAKQALESGKALQSFKQLLKK